MTGKNCLSCPASLLCVTGNMYNPIVHTSISGRVTAEIISKVLNWETNPEALLLLIARGEPTKTKEYSIKFGPDDWHTCPAVKNAVKKIREGVDCYGN